MLWRLRVSELGSNCIDRCKITASIVLFFLCGAFVVQAGIGGKTAEDGPFLLDDAEDLDLNAVGVARDWISDYVPSHGDVLDVLVLPESGLTLMPAQTPIGALRASVPEEDAVGTTPGWMGKGFGVPVPSLPGQSTADYPGDFTSYNFLNFKACYDPDMANAEFLVVLEAYPKMEIEPRVLDYPKVYWKVYPPLGSSFMDVWMDLWDPIEIAPPDSVELSALLSQTRFFYFYAGAYPVEKNSLMLYDIDDIRLVHAEVGGKSAYEGTMIIDDAEDLDLTADGVERDWIPDNIAPVGAVLTTFSLTSSGMTLAVGQSAIGALLATVPETHTGGKPDGDIDGGFSLPLPLIPGASEEDYPADLSGFRALAFEACSGTQYSGQEFSVTLLAGQGPVYAELLWELTPLEGDVFATVEIDLRHPDEVKKTGGLSVDEMLSQVRQLEFKISAMSVPHGSTAELYLDDVRLLARDRMQSARVKQWMLY